MILRLWPFEPDFRINISPINVCSNSAARITTSQYTLFLFRQRFSQIFRKKTWFCKVLMQ